MSLYKRSSDFTSAMKFYVEQKLIQAGLDEADYAEELKSAKSFPEVMMIMVKKIDGYDVKGSNLTDVLNNAGTAIAEQAGVTSLSKTAKSTKKKA